MTARLAFDGVACRRSSRILFSGLSFAATAGAAILVTGPNGAGKSSLVRVAAGLLSPYAGNVTTEGGCALLGEASALDTDRTLAHALGFWATIDGRRDAVPKALAAFDLTALADVPVRLLSTGQRKRAGLARIAASGASIWLLDEPANGLDAAAITLLEVAIDRHRAASGIALVATHQPIMLDAAQHIVLESAA